MSDILPTQEPRQTPVVRSSADFRFKRIVIVAALTIAAAGVGGLWSLVSAQRSQAAAAQESNAHEVKCSEYQAALRSAAVGPRSNDSVAGLSSRDAERITTNRQWFRDKWPEYAVWDYVGIRQRLLDAWDTWTSESFIPTGLSDQGCSL